MSAGRIALGALIGMAVGASLGVLFAPDKGVATRKKLAKEGTRYLGSLKNSAGEYVDNLAGKLDTVRESAVSLAESTKERLDSAIGHETQKQARKS